MEGEVSNGIVLSALDHASVRFVRNDRRQF
jgi:hypothetical protein